MYSHVLLLFGWLLPWLVGKVRCGFENVRWELSTPSVGFIGVRGAIYEK